MFYIPTCQSSTAKSRARPRSTASRAWRSSGRSTRTWAASTAAPSATSAPSSSGPTGPPTTATAARSASRRTSPRSCARSSPGRAGSSESVAIGAATDPYQPAEGRYRLTRGCLEALGDAANPFSIITRGPLIVRDVGCPRRGRSPRQGLRHLLGPDLDDEIWRKTEPGTAHPRQRLRALKRSSTPASGRASAWHRSCRGSRTGPNCSSESCARRARPARAESGRTCSSCARNARAFPREARRGLPGAAPAYERLYARRAYLGAAETKPVRAPVRRARAEHGIRDRRRTRLAPARNRNSWRSRSSRFRPGTYNPQAVSASAARADARGDHLPDRRRPRGRPRGLRLSLSRAPHIRVIGEAATARPRSRSPSGASPTS